MDTTNQMIQCPSCGKNNPLQAKFCGYCGQEIPQQPHTLTNTTKDTQESGSTSAADSRLDIRKDTFLVDEEINGSEDSAPDVWTKAAIILGILCVVALVLLVLTQTSFSPLKLSQAFYPPSPTPVASPSPSQTMTITAMPSFTPTALSTPTETITPTFVASLVPLNIRRQDVQTVYANLGFAFHETLAQDHLPRWIGKSIDGFVSIELLGDPHALTRIIIIAVDSHVGHQDTVNYSYMDRCVKLLAPDWKEGSDWLAKSLYKFDNTPEEREMTLSTNYKDLKILMNNDKRNGVTNFTIEKTQ